MNCPRCKAKLPENSIFCYKCGKKVEVKKSVKQRGNGTGSAYKRGKTWTAVVVVGWKENAEEKQMLPIKRYKGGFPTKKDALAYVPTLFGEKPKERVTFYDIYKGWSTSAMLKLSNSKQTAYKIAWAKLESIAYTDISLIKIDTLQIIINEKTPTYYTAKDAKNLLSKLYDRAIAEQYVNINLADYIVLPDLNEKPQEAFTETEQLALWQDYGAGSLFTGYILLMIYTGMMPGELLLAKKEMINWDKRQIIGCGKKTKKRKETPIVIADPIEPVLKHLCEETKGDKLIRINKDRFYDVFKETLERCGCRPLPPYSCRHTTATALALENIPPSVIQEIMRHTKFATTQRYIHVNTDTMLEAVNRLSNKTQLEEKTKSEVHDNTNKSE